MIEKMYVAIIVGIAGAMFYTLPGLLFGSGEFKDRARKYSKLLLLFFSVFSVLALIGLVISDGTHYTDEESDAYDRATYNR